MAVRVREFLGVIGPARLLKAWRAGARRVLSRRWKEDDRATAVFTGPFYEALLRCGLAPAAALAEAQRARRATTQPRRASYCGASFDIQGDL